MKYLKKKIHLKLLDSENPIIKFVHSINRNEMEKKWFHHEHNHRESCRVNKTKIFFNFFLTHHILLSHA